MKPAEEILSEPPGHGAEVDAVAEVDEPQDAAAGDPGLAAERDRLARALRETRLQLAMTQSRLTALEQSATMELGRTLVRAARRPWSRGVQLPADLVRLWRERGGLTGPGAATLALASAQLGDLAGGGERFLSALTAPGLGAPGTESAGWTPPGLVITGVLTAQACATLAPDAAVHPLLPHDADVVLESTGANLVCIEAAAMLAGSAWAYAGDPAATDRGRRLGRLIAAARALGKPVIFIRNIPAHLAPGLDWVAASCDAVSDEGFGVQLARFNPIGLADSRPSGPVYADARDPREPPALRAWLDALTDPDRARIGAGHRVGAVAAAAGPLPAARAVRHGVRGPGARAARLRRPRDHDRRGAGPRCRHAAGGGWDVPALRETAGALRARPPLAMAEILPVLREIFTGQATPARLAALGRLTGLGDHVIAGRRIAVLARADDAGAAAALSAGLSRQRFLPAELVVVTEAPDATSAEMSARAVTAALGDLADRGVSVRAVPLVTAGPAGWLRHAASSARSPWVAPWPAAGEHHESYLLDLACARECAQADVTGYAGAGYAFTATLDPALARREFFASTAIPATGCGSSPSVSQLRSISVDLSGACLR